MLAKFVQEAPDIHASHKIIPLHRESKARSSNLFVQRLTELVEANIADERYDIGQLCKDARVSRANLHRKLKTFVNLSSSKFIRAVRLKKARVLLLFTDLNIAEIAYSVGFGDPKYFSRVFSEEFRQSPRAFRNRSLDVS